MNPIFTGIVVLGSAGYVGGYGMAVALLYPEYKDWYRIFWFRYPKHGRDGTNYE